MIKVENIEVWGFEHAIRGMRNPMNSWDKSDSLFEGKNILKEEVIKKGTLLTGIGKNDLALMRKLYKAGPEHRKYLRQIFVSMDITAPLYWWKEFDTYKVGTVANSCSTMHKITESPFWLEHFSYEHLEGNLDDINTPYGLLSHTIDILNDLRCEYFQLRDNNERPEFIKSKWWQIIQLLPSSYNQRRTITMNYENVITIIKQRTGHKLDEWNEFVRILGSLPYIHEIMEE